MWYEGVVGFISSATIAAEWSTKLVREIVKTRPDEQGNVISHMQDKLLSKVAMGSEMMKALCGILRDADNQEHKRWMTCQLFSLKKLERRFRKCQWRRRCQQSPSCRGWISRQCHVDPSTTFTTRTISGGWLTL